jgi:hypothetical protein
MEKHEAQQFLNRLADCADSIRGQRSVIEYVIERGQQPKYLQGGTSTMWLLVNPVPGADGIYHWTKVSPSVPESRDVVTNRMRRGYLPVGILDVETRCADVFVDVVPKAYREDFIKFASLEIQSTYNHLLDGSATALSIQSLTVYSPRRRNGDNQPTPRDRDE